MGVVVSFLERLKAARDWTASERARLESVADWVASETAGGARAAFGVSDQGDPWFVVKDADDEVVVHVARIDGRFVLHAVDIDEVQEGPDLMALVGRTLGEAAVQEVLAPAAASVSMFGEREQQRTLYPALVAGTLVYEVLQHLPEAARREFLLDSEDAAHAPSVAHFTAAPAAEFAAPPPRLADRAPAPPAQHASADQPPPPAPEAAPVELEECAPAEVQVASHAEIFGPPQPANDAGQPQGARLAPAAPLTTGGGLFLIGGPGDDVLVGSLEADVLQGGDGDDVLDGGGAPAGQLDVLIGGAGDDTIYLGPQTIAVGGEGNDMFVAVFNRDGNAARRPDGPLFMGTILDFAFDRVLLGSHVKVQIVSVDAEADVVGATYRAEGMAWLYDFTTPPLIAGFRVGLDFDEDGREDAYIMLGLPRQPPREVGLSGHTPPTRFVEGSETLQLPGEAPPMGFTLIHDPGGAVLLVGGPGYIHSDGGG